MGTAENKGIVRRIYEVAINNHDLDLLDSWTFWATTSCPTT
jgi:hypothetical protein